MVNRRISENVDLFLFSSDDRNLVCQTRSHGSHLLFFFPIHSISLMHSTLQLLRCVFQPNWIVADSCALHCANRPSWSPLHIMKHKTQSPTFNTIWVNYTWEKNPYIFKMPLFRMIHKTHTLTHIELQWQYNVNAEEHFMHSLKMLLRQLGQIVEPRTMLLLMITNPGNLPHHCTCTSAVFPGTMHRLFPKCIHLLVNHWHRKILLPWIMLNTKVSIFLPLY